MNREPLYIIIILHTDGSIQMQALEDADEAGWEQLQSIVGGDIQIVPATYGILLVNVDGKMYPLPYNANATAMMKNKGPDYIVGDAVLCVLSRNQHGEEVLAGIPLRHAARIADSLREEVTV